MPQDIMLPVTDMLRFIGLTHGGVEISFTTFQTDCSGLHQVSQDTLRFFGLTHSGVVILLT